MIKGIPDTPAGLRDRALLLLGFAAALRRSELVALDVGDLETVDDGVFVHVRRSKTDQEGLGDQIAIPRGAKLRVVEAIEAWVGVRMFELKDASLEIQKSDSLNFNENSTALTPSDTDHANLRKNASSDSGTPLFVSIAKGGRLESQRLSDRAVALIIKKWAAAAKLDPKLFSGHSLRAGFVTSALEDGADPFAVMKITRHKRVDTLGIYDRRAQAFKNHAGKGFL
jgi:site-specific recombinase XerD